MFNAELTITKEVMQFNDQDTGNDLKFGGIRVKLAPKIAKFFTLENMTTGRRDNLELLQALNPNLYQWYVNSSAGAEIRLREMSATTHSTIQDIYSNSENQL